MGKSKHKHTNQHAHTRRAIKSRGVVLRFDLERQRRPRRGHTTIRRAHLKFLFHFLFSARETRGAWGRRRARVGKGHPIGATNTTLSTLSSFHHRPSSLIFVRVPVALQIRNNTPQHQSEIFIFLFSVPVHDDNGTTSLAPSVFRRCPTKLLLKEKKCFCID